MLAIVTQLRYELQHHGIAKHSIETLFIGGGTPSCVAPDLYQPFFDLVQPFLQKDCEITSEANPNSATFEWLKGMYSLGVNRISFGTQTFNDKKLKLLNRAHTAKETIKALNNAKKIGFKNLSLDLIYATAMDTKKLLSSDLEQAFKLPINHISAYSLTIEEGTPFTKTPQVATEKESLTHFLFDTLQEKGFTQYEISNFGTYQSKHNTGYWEYKPYLGIGSGAVGMLNNTRFYPHSDVQAYIDSPLFTTKEVLSDENIFIEKVLLGFRSNVGVSKSILSKEALQRCELLVQENKLTEKNTTFYNTNYLLADEIALFVTS